MVTEEQAAVVVTQQPERYVRINITKQSKGYVHETTIALRWSDEHTDANWGEVMGELHFVAEAEARGEIARREALDARTASAAS